MGTEKNSGPTVIDVDPMAFGPIWAPCERSEIRFKNGVVLEAIIEGWDIGIIVWTITRHYQGTAARIAGRQETTIEAAKDAVITAIGTWRTIMEPDLS